MLTGPHVMFAVMVTVILGATPRMRVILHRITCSEIFIRLLNRIKSTWKSQHELHWNRWYKKNLTVLCKGLNIINFTNCLNERSTRYSTWTFRADKNQQVVPPHSQNTLAHFSDWDLILGCLDGVSVSGQHVKASRALSDA